MAVKLTQNGIQFPDGTTQESRIGSWNTALYVSSVSGTPTSYTWANIFSQTAKRIRVNFSSIVYNTGPQSPIIRFIRSDTNWATLDGLGISYYGTSPNSFAANSVSSGSSNIWIGPTYSTFNDFWLDMTLIEDSSSVRKYVYEYWGSTSSTIVVGTGKLVGGSYPITGLYLSTGSSAYYTQMIATAWQQ